MNFYKQRSIKKQNQKRINNDKSQSNDLWILPARIWAVVVVVGEVEGIRQGDCGPGDAKLGTDKLNLLLDLVDVAGDLDGRLQVGAGKAEEEGPIVPQVAVGEHGGVGRNQVDQRLMMSKPIKQIQDLKGYWQC